MIRVLLVDDHALVRAGLRALLQSGDIDVVGAASDGEQAVQLCAELLPDVVLMDLSMPGMDGAEATRRIRSDCPDAQVVVLTSSSDGERVWEALDAGAVGYLLKDAEPAVLVQAIRDAAAGGAPLSPRAATALLPHRQPRTAASALSDREREVLALVAEGLPNRLIARRLEIAEKTVKTHLTRVFAVLGVSDRTSAALWAQRHDLGA